MTTKTRKLEKEEWGPYFDHLSKNLQLKSVTIFVEGLNIGVQLETEQVVLTGITYDHADDAIEVSTDVHQHRIQGPHELFVQEDAAGALHSLKVTDAYGNAQIAQLTSSLTLAPRR